MSRWTDDLWRAPALDWAERELRRLGYDVAGAAEQFHIRPWSTIFRLPTSRGNVYLKAVPADLAHEVALTRWLADHFPERVLPVLAADVRHGLMLLPEGGARLREVGTDLRGWERLVRGYAELQLLVAPHVTDLLLIGVPDRRLALLPRAFAEILPGSGSAGARYAALCAELASIGIPETIQMDDLHDGNVFVDGERLRVFDWGDASISHPFVCLGMILQTFAQRGRLAREDAAVGRVRDAYLEAFSAFSAFERLRRAARLAELVAPTVRILAWQMALGKVPAQDRAGESGETLEELIEQQRSALRARR